METVPDYPDIVSIPDERSSSGEIQSQSRSLSGALFPNRLFDAVPSMFFLLNENRQVVFANRTVFRTLGIEGIEDVYGLRPGEILQCIFAERNDNGCGTSDFCSQCGANTTIRLSLIGAESARECSLLRRNENGDMEALDLMVWAAPFEFEGRRYSAFSVLDMSHEKRRRALERIFFHDILNIAGGIRTFTEFLAMEGGNAGPEELSVIHNYARKLVDEIQAQRELARAENNELSLRLAPFDSREFLEDSISMYREHEAARDKTLVIGPESVGVSMVSDPVLLGRVLGNLLKNALEATAPGGTIFAECLAEGDGVEFRVRNDGFIPSDTQKMIFRRSFSTKAADRGLGTYSLKLISERYLGGRVSFASTEREGTVFRVWLPRVLENPASPEGDVDGPVAG